MPVVCCRFTDGILYSSVVLIPCPGADPHKTWTRDPLPDDVFRTKPSFYPAQFSEIGPPLMTMTGGVLQPAIDPVLPYWTRGIRKEANIARILTYKHCRISNRVTLKHHANDLLRLLFRERGGKVGSVAPDAKASISNPLPLGHHSPHLLHLSQHRRFGSKVGLDRGEPEPQVSVNTPRLLRSHIFWYGDSRGALRSRGLN
jgi:hypothetical protein